MAKRIPKSIPVPPLTDAMYRAALKSAKSAGPFDVVVVCYDRNADTVDLTLRKGVIVRLPRLQIRELADSRPADMRRVKIQPGGDGISIPAINVDIYVPGLLADEFVPLFAKALGKRSNGRASALKAVASRESGRPRKVAP